MLCRAMLHSRGVQDDVTCTTCLQSVLAATVCHHAQSLSLQVHLAAMYVLLRARQHQQEQPLARADPDGGQASAESVVRCLQVSISTDPTRSVEITDSDSVIVDYTYSVKWEATETPFEKRMDKYRKYQFLPQHLEVMSEPALPASLPAPVTDGVQASGMHQLEVSCLWRELI